MTERTDTFSRTLLIRLFALTLVLLLAALGTFSYAAIGAFERQMLPEIHRKATLVGHTVRNDIVRVVGYGIPIAEMIGMGEYLGDVLTANPDVRYLLLTDMEGTVLHGGGSDQEEARRLIGRPPAGAADLKEDEPHRLDKYLDTSVPIVIDGTPRGVLHVGVADDLVRRRLAAIVYDAVTVLLVTLLVTFEFLSIVVMVHVVGPIRRIEELLQRGARGDFTWRIPDHGGGDEFSRFGRAFNGMVRRLNEHYQDVAEEAEETRAAQIDAGIVARIQAVRDGLGRRYRLVGEAVREMVNPNALLRIRIPFFLFILAEELTRPFLPVFIRSLQQPALGLTPQMVLGLPISAFMLSIAVITPFAAGWTDRFGVRRVFLMGAVPSVAGFIGSALAVSVLDLMVWRSLCGIGYAVIYIACQSYVAENAKAESRVSGMAFIMGAVFAAAICGPSLGGIMADRIGFSTTFAVSAVLVLLAAIMINSSIAGAGTTRPPRPAAASRPALRILMRAPRFLALTVFAAVPAKIILTGVLFYLVPLYLTELGDTQSSIGRVMMVYGLMNVVIMPVAARFANRLTNLPSLVGVGAIISGAGAMAVLAADNTWMVALAVTMVGLGHAISIAPQLVLVQIVCEDVDPTITRSTALGAFRLVERFGNIIGPFLVAGLLSLFGYSRAMAYTGALVAVGGMIFLAISALAASRKAEDAA
ncbi:MAG: MFS transporter [Alphaproteobacteria bacterium]